MTAGIDASDVRRKLGDDRKAAVDWRATHTEWGLGMSEPTRKTRTRLGRRLSWLVVGTMLATALLAPGATANAAPLDGAIWTSLSDGTIVNQNLYENKSDVYLNGGPQNCGNSNGLPDGLYYFQVTDPSGKTLLSDDAVKFRMVEVKDGVIAGVGGTGNHLEGSEGCNGGKPVQLMPYDDTPNNGGEYSVDLAPAAEIEACEGFSADSTTFNFRDCNPSSKNDNFKVGEADPTDTPPTDTPPTDTPPTDTPPTDTPPTDTPPTDTPPTDTPPTATPTGGVNPATGTPASSVAPTLPPTDLSGGTGDGPTGDAWRLVLVALAGVLAAALLLTPASAVVRRKD